MEEQTLLDKCCSTKFLLCAAAALASIGESVASIAAGYPEFAKYGIVCTVLSSAIYAGTRMGTDCAAIKANASTTQTVKTVTATTSAAKTVEKMAGIEGENGTK